MSQAMTNRIDKHRFIAGMLLILLTLGTYSRVVQCGYIWDDDFYVTHNPTLQSIDGLVDIWVSPGATPQYYPLVFSGFWIEHQLWGLNPIGYHLVNVLLHAMGVLLFWKLLQRLGLPSWPTWIAAALFAVHPVHVESVAWITERKNVLSGVFYLAAFMMYWRFDQTRHKGVWLGAVAFFVAALLSKTVVATLPAAILVVIWWQRGRINLKRDLVPLLPLWIIGIGFGVVTVLMEKFHVGADGAGWDHSLGERVLIAGRAITFYFTKLIWPSDLMFTYPRWQINASALWQWLFPLGVLAVLVTLGVGACRGREQTDSSAAKFQRRGLAAGGFLFCGTLFPALGFFDVFPFTYSYVADHFQYLASLGVLTLVAVALSRKPIVAVMVILLLSVLSWVQIGAYRDAETLWLHTIKQNPGAWMAYNNLGVIKVQQGDEARGRELFKQALAVEPGYAEALNNLGNLALQQKHLDEAITQYQAALTSRPGFYRAHMNLGVALQYQNHDIKAIEQFQAALAVMPSDQVHARLAQSYFALANLPQANEHASKALAMNAQQLDAMIVLGRIAQSQGQLRQAQAIYRQVLSLFPSHTDANEYLGKLLIQQGNAKQGSGLLAIAAWTLSTHPQALMRDGSRAVELAEQACALRTKDHPFLLDALAAAYAETGQFPQALKAIGRAVVAVGGTGGTGGAGGGRGGYAQQLQSRQRVYYENKKPYRDLMAGQ